MEGLIAVNGKITTPEDAVVPALDRGLLFGDNVFEVMVGFGANLLDLQPHLQRLRRSADNLSFTIPWTNEELSFEAQSLAQRVAEETKADKIYLRILVTRGRGLGLMPSEEFEPTKIMYCFRAPEEPLSSYTTGVQLKRMVLPATERGPAAKTGNYLRSILALKKASQAGFSDVLWTNSQGEITEASTANVFFMRRQGDEVDFVTPPSHSGLLMGITRANVIQLLNEAKIPAREEIIFADEIPRFDEAFLCSTIKGLVPISAIDRHILHTAREKSVFRHIERLFLTWVETQIGHRVDWRTGKAL